jgi:single-strand DNA-binding protein
MNMEIVGRVTTNAVVKQPKDERKVVNFSIAVNDYYKRKGTEKGEQTVLYINCAYWINPTISTRLTKGSIVELNGRLQLNPYIGFDGEAKASLNLHVNTIKIHQSVKASDVPTVQAPHQMIYPFDE